MPLLFSLRFRVTNREDHQSFQRVEPSRGRMDARFLTKQRDRTAHCRACERAENPDRNSLLFLKNFPVLREFEKRESGGGLGRPDPRAGWLQIRCKCSQTGMPEDLT
jgi:hypothetical protein